MNISLACVRPIAVDFRQFLRPGQIALLLTLLLATEALAYYPRQRWEMTANGPTGFRGDPVDLTWSLVPDGTPTSGDGDSDLVAFLDGIFDVNGSLEGLDERPWFPVIESTFQRWSDLSGITFHFDADDGANVGQVAGELGVRGDIRLAGRPIDGVGDVLALSTYPEDADIVLDTDDRPLFSNQSGGYLRLRNVLMHEIGHSLGFAHIVSSDAAWLMEPTLTTAFDGPQLDEIRAAHWYYGDALEKTHQGSGNNSAATAFDLGLLEPGATASIGTGAATGAQVAASELDFVSIDNNLDFDYYSFSIAEPAALNLVLTPRGGLFHQAVVGEPEVLIDANARSNLTLSVLGPGGEESLAFANEAPVGQVESITNLLLPEAGEYFVRVTGISTHVQLYQLEASLVAAVSNPAGDYNGDGTVGAADYIVWRNSVGQTGAGIAADGNDDQAVDQLDYELWKANFGSSAPVEGAGELASVPEPATPALVGGALLLAALARRRRGVPAATA